MARLKRAKAFDSASRREEKLLAATRLCFSTRSSRQSNSLTTGKTRELQRLEKGLYYRPRHCFCKSDLPGAIQLPIPRKVSFQPVLSAANLLVLRTEPDESQLSTPASSFPRTIIGRCPYLTRRPGNMEWLSDKEAAYWISSDNARNRTLSEETLRKLLGISGEKTFERLAGIALSEPPRVRAILGAIGQQLERVPIFCAFAGKPQSSLSFDFGTCPDETWRTWQAKERKLHETV